MNTQVDTADYSASNAGVTVDLAAGTGTGGHAEGDTLSGIERLDGSNFADTLTGSGSDDTIFGNAGDDTIDGGAGVDTIDGGEGDDILRGGAGADILTGGAGLDTVDYSGSAQSVFINLETRSASGGDAQGDSFFEIERVIGGLAADQLTGDGLNNILDGREGDDLLIGGGGADALI